MSDVPGLLSAPPDPESLISTLKISQVDGLKAKGIIDKGMRPKVASAIRALQEGVQRVHFIDGRLPHFTVAGDLHRHRDRHGNRARLIRVLRRRALFPFDEPVRHPPGRR
jgi:hypothetical protein